MLLYPTGILYKTIREDSPHLPPPLNEAMACDGEDRRTTAGRCLGDRTTFCVVIVFEEALINVSASTYVSQLIEAMACDGEDRRTTAGRCLGELVRKMGDRVLGRIIPIMRQGLSAESADTRQGVCFGLKEVRPPSCAALWFCFRPCFACLSVAQSWARAGNVIWKCHVEMCALVSRSCARRCLPRVASMFAVVRTVWHAPVRDCWRLRAASS